MNSDIQGGAPQERTSEIRPPPQTPMGQNYRFTQEELRVLRQCNRDSFYQRCLPIGTALGGAIYFAIKNGYLRPHVRFGAAPKVTAAVVIGYFIGKFSYQSKCAEMLMKLPDSQIGEMLRQKRRQGGSTSYSDTISLDPGFGTGFPIPFGETEVYSDIAPTHDLDSDRPYQKGLDEFYRPSLDSPATGEEIVPPVTQPRVQTYEELRRKNREEYDQRKGKPYRSGSAPEDVPTTLQPHAQPPLAEPSHSPERPLERNKYGDVWEK